MSAKEKADLKEHFSRQDDERLNADVAEIMATPAGRRVFIAIIFAGGVYTHTRANDHLEYLAGRRDGALEIMQVVNVAAPELLLLARKERADVMAERNRQLKIAERT